MSNAPPPAVLDRSAAFFESVLWEAEMGEGARDRLARHGLEQATLREFRVGYAPGNTRPLLDHLRSAGHSDADLIAAGLAVHSDRERLHGLFHARIMFPIRDAQDRVVGFAGLATHLGPSWPLWLSSPDGPSYQAGTAIFGIGEAAPAIRDCRRALVLRDPVQVLALHQDGRREAVAVVQSPITREHLAQLAGTLGVRPPDLHLARRDGRLGVAAVPAGAEVTDRSFAERSVLAGFSLINSPRPEGSTTPALVDEQRAEDEEPPARLIVYVAGFAVGVGIPLGTLLLADTSVDPETGPAPAFSVVIVGIVTAYLVLALAVARVSARARARSTGRRMRMVWVRGKDEVQPVGWTHHRLEEVLVGAALVSAVVCVALLMTLGGFLG